jgi:CRP-like cAMP-binding protein
MSKEIHSSNILLASLSEGDFDLIKSGLRLVELPQKLVLVEAGAKIPAIYFPHRGILSLVVRLQSGQAIEAAMVGKDGVFGAIAALDGLLSVVTAVVQIAGVASVIDISTFRRAAAQSATLSALMMRHEQAVLAQALQAAACNSVHSIPQRLARWLLRARDLTGVDTLAFTQEFLAQMLGSQRNSVTIEAKNLQDAGIIKYKRGNIEILNLNELKARSCECYDTVKGFYQNLLVKPAAKN